MSERSRNQMLRGPGGSPGSRSRAWASGSATENVAISDWQFYKVPLRFLSAGGTAWQALRDECFCSELKMEPSDALLMRPIQHGHR
jgi:hypothetical protein